MQIKLGWMDAQSELAIWHHTPVWKASSSPKLIPIPSRLVDGISGLRFMDKGTTSLGSSRSRDSTHGRTTQIGYPVRDGLATFD